MIPLPLAAQRLRIRQDTARDWVCVGRLEGQKLGGTRWHVTVASIERLLRNRPHDPYQRDARGRFTIKQEASRERAFAPGVRGDAVSGRV